MTKGLNIALAIVASLGIQTAASAHNDHCFQDYTVTDGFGDGIKVHHGLLGTSKQTVVQDRLGDKYVNDKGLFTSTQGARVLGNGYTKHKGLIGGTQLQASDMFGDSIQSRKTFLGLGRRQTNVNLSGVTGIAQGLLGSRFGQKLTPTRLVDTSAFPNVTAPAAPADPVNAAATPAPSAATPSASTEPWPSVPSTAAPSPDSTP